MIEYMYHKNIFIYYFSMTKKYLIDQWSGRLNNDSQSERTYRIYQTTRSLESWLFRLFTGWDLVKKQYKKIRSQEEFIELFTKLVDKEDIYVSSSVKQNIIELFNQRNELVTTIEFDSEPNYFIRKNSDGEKKGIQWYKASLVHANPIE